VISTLVDSNVLIDVISGNSGWETWSSAQLVKAADAGSLAINTVVYAEVSIGFDRVEACDSALDELQLAREPIPWPAAFLAGKAFADYRRRGGIRSGPLPDFFIGAHAAVGGMRLLTRDQARYRSYFPRLELICPS
jgi:predicted nucleic acid-binding protein